MRGFPMVQTLSKDPGIGESRPPRSDVDGATSGKIKSWQII